EARGEQGQDHGGAQHRQQQDPSAPPGSGRVEEDLGGGSAHGRISSRSFLAVRRRAVLMGASPPARSSQFVDRSEEHTSELQSRFDLVCRLLLEKKIKVAREPTS